MMRMAFAVGVIVVAGCALYDQKPPRETRPRDPVLIGPGDGGREPRPGYPGSGINGDPGAGALWLIRVDRGTANLAGTYAGMISDATAELRDGGVEVVSSAVGTLYGGRLLWSGGWIDPAAISDALTAAAASSDGTSPKTCTGAALAQTAAALTTLIDDGSWSPPFDRPLSAFLVAVIDSGARPYPADDPACWVSGTHPVSHFGGDPADWLATQVTLPRPQVRILAVHTPEAGTTAQARAACDANARFPDTALDFIEASPHAFFEPFVDGLSAGAPGAATGWDLCGTVGTAWSKNMEKFADAWAAELRQQPEYRW